MVVESNPILTRRFRGGELESIHRGCWTVVDVDGNMLAAAGDPDQWIFPRSASKSMQGLGPMIAGAAERFALTDEQLAVTISSHNGEPDHERVVGTILERLGLDESVLRCGRATPFDEPRAEPRRIRHNCSGKHAGFLAGALALGQDPTTYLDPDGAIQQLIQEQVCAIADLGPNDWKLAIDGCSAPTFIMPLRALALGIARVTNPGQLDQQRADACRRLTGAATSYPHLVAGRRPSRFDTELLDASAGRLFAKGGADGMQVIGVRDAGIAFAGKADDGNTRGLLPVAIEVLGRLGHVGDAERNALAEWIDPTIRNADQLEVGVQQLAAIDL